MTISSRGLDFITNEEKFVSKPYLDGGGVPTIGIGTTVYPDGKKVTMADPAITIEKAKEYLNSHVTKRVIPYIEFGITVPLSQGKIDALCSFIYNVGGEAFSNSTLRKVINNGGGCDDVAAQFARWNKDNGKVVKGLTKRRTRETNLYCNG